MTDILRIDHSERTDIVCVNESAIFQERAHNHCFAIVSVRESPVACQIVFM